MRNNFFAKNEDENSINLFLRNIYSYKVGFYSVGLYPASLAYNCSMHGSKNNILLAPRPGRKLFGAFSNDELLKMDPKIIENIKGMGTFSDKNKIRYYQLSDLIKKCNIVILASNSNHIQEDIEAAIKLKKSLKREKVVLTCLVGSFCVDNDQNNPFILCEKYPKLSFFTGFHRHGALRNSKDSFTANFCHPDSITALIGARILNQLSPKIQVSAGVHNIECQYIKAIKNISSIFAGFVNDYHSDKPGMLPTINTVLLTQCLDQAASVSSVVRKGNPINSDLISLNELGYGVDMIKAHEIKGKKYFEKRDHTFSQLNAVLADVLGSMTLPSEGKPTRNFQAGQVLSSMFLKLNRCPSDMIEFLNFCVEFSLSQGSMEGLKSLKFWPSIYKKYKIPNNNCSMINLIYLCFHANDDEKKDIFKVLTDPEELTNYCQESVKSKKCLDLSFKYDEIDLFKDNSLLFNVIHKKDLNNKKVEKINPNDRFENHLKYIKVIKLVNKYFSN